jgi:surface protein
VTKMGGMFKYCDVLTSITVSATGWQTSQANTSGFLDNCPAQIIKK